MNDESDKLKSSMIEIQQKLSQSEIELTNSKTLMDEMNQNIIIKDNKIVYIIVIYLFILFIIF